MCYTMLHRTTARSSHGVCLTAWVVLLLVLCPGSLETVLDKSRHSSTVWHTYEIEKGQNIKNFKRHSDGTFTSDFTHYLDKIKAKDFVEWLTSNSRTGGVERWDENQSLVVEA